MDLDPHEYQALLRYHCATIIEAVDDDGLKPSKWPELQRTGVRIRQIIDALKPSEKNMPPEPPEMFSMTSKWQPWY